MRPTTDEQKVTIKGLEKELGPAPDGLKRKMPAGRASANRYIRSLRQVQRTTS